MSIRPGWYYHAHEDDKVKSLPQLLDIYYNSIGRNSSLLINFPVDKRGLIHENDRQQIMKLAAKIKEDFSEDLAQKASIITAQERGKGFEVGNILNQDPKKYWTTKDGVDSVDIYFTFPEPTRFNRFLIQEHIPLGQRIKKFELEVETENGWEKVYAGTTVGYKRILRFDEVETQRLRLKFSESKASPTISKVGIYLAPPLDASHL